MEIRTTEYSTLFGAKIKIDKQKIGNKFQQYTGETSIFGGSSTISSALASGADVVIHESNSAAPYIQNSSSIFDQLSRHGHKMLGILLKNNHAHNGYDASFFSSVQSITGIMVYSNGINNTIKGMEKIYKNKIPT